MNYNVVTLEIADLITHFDYYNKLVPGVLKKNDDEAAEEYAKIRKKSAEHIARFLNGAELFDANGEVKHLSDIKAPLIAMLQGMRSKDIHDMIEKLEKDAKKVKKLYLALAKEQK